MRRKPQLHFNVITSSYCLVSLNVVIAFFLKIRTLSKLTNIKNMLTYVLSTHRNGKWFFPLPEAGKLRVNIGSEGTQEFTTCVLSCKDLLTFQKSITSRKTPLFTEKTNRKILITARYCLQVTDVLFIGIS